MRFDLVTLNLVLAIAETRSITRGAEREHLALAAASKRLSDLETRLGVQLFERRARGVEPTAAGLALIRHIRSLHASLHAMEEEVAEFSRGIRGHLRVVANASAIAECLPPDLAAFSRAHPEIRISLEDQTSAELQRSVAEGAADVGIFVPPLLEPARLQTWSYRDGTLVLITPVGHALAQQPAVRFADLLEHDFIGQHTGAALQQMLLAQATELGRPLRARMQVRGFDAIAQLVEAGLGIALMPSAVAQRLARLFRLEIVALDEPWARRDYRVGVRAQEVLPAVVRRFVEFLCPAAFVSADEPSSSLFPSPHPSSPTENPS
ncbi:transcription regulator protein [Sphaerotilus natans subsp. natans DSM 6575]|uniref:Transcription regulator protein n=1 Tax=Sphaerotilus natans subsp. natans DSM 6575 TaxID=1286631 RepID=A0A059KFQ1_9BURK|nr:LysR family transcriptional regulator [Sphaerotilus natans]KDB50307.1 transcription regulator protein [Sphaerotilus natans subsp. natans DSM 6575]SIR16022.1 DNA-binding transcriptional regulator, LysR family [Sphaerotilus natans]